MTFNRYAITVLLPNLIICALLGKPAKAIEQVARKIRMACCRRMQRVILYAPPKEKRDA